MGFGIDMAKAKEIHKNKIREARTDKFNELDVEFTKALENGSDTTEIKNKKQALRDAPAASAIDDATNVTELKAQWDTSILGDKPEGY